MTTYTVDIYEPAGLTVVHTSTNVVDARGTWRRNGVGDGYLVFMGQDEDLATETTQGRIAHVYTERSSLTLTVALFNIEARSFFHDEDGVEYVRISGTGFEDRIGRHLITAEIHDGAHGPATDDIEQIMAFQPGWSLSSTSNTGTQDGTWHSFREATILQALQAAAAQSGEMWRLDTLSTVKREISWRTIPESDTSWNFTLYNDADEYDNEATEGLIRTFDRGYDQSELVTRIYMYGSGTGDDRLTAREATWSAPAGFSFHPSASLLVNDTLESQGHFNERVVHFSDIRLPNTRHEIVEKDAANDWISIRGDYTTLFTAGATFRVVDATDGNGAYTVDSSSYDAEDDLTTINTVEDITGGSEDGFIEAASFEIVGVDAADDEFVIRGDWTDLFVADYEFDVEGGPSAGSYTVASSSYDSDEDETTIAVDEDITDGTVSGFIVLDGSIGSAAVVTAANALAAAGYVWLRDRTGGERYHKIAAVYWRNAQPGDRVRIIYQHGRVDLTEVHVIDEVSYSIDDAGIRVMTIVTSPLGVHRSPPTEETVAMKLMATLDDLLKHGTGSRISGGTSVPTMEAHLAAQDPHPTYLLANGGRQLIGNLPVASGVQIDGVDISAHAADPDAHHDPVTAGDGIGVSGQVVSLDTPGTLSATSSNNVTANSHTHAVTASSNPGAAERLLKSTAGGALTLEQLTADNVRLDGNTVSSISGDLTLDPAGDDILIPSADRIGTDNFVSQLTGWRIDYDGHADFRTMYADELHVRAFIADIEQALAGGQIVSKSVALLSRDFEVPVGGRDIINADTADDFVTISGDLSDEIDDGQAFQIRQSTGNNGTYTVDHTEVSGAGDTRIYVTTSIPDGTADGVVRFRRTIHVEDLPGFENTQVFADNDWLRLRVIDRSGGGLTVTDVWGTVAAYSDLSGGEQSWTFTCRDDGSVPGNVVFAGALVLDYGQSDDGYWEVTALDDDGPYSQIVTWTSDPSVSGNHDLRTRVGNLDGVTDPDMSPSGFGLYSDNAYLKGDLIAAGGDVEITSDGIRMDADQGKFSSAAIEWYSGATRKFSIGTTVDLGAVTGAYLESDVGLNITSTAGNIDLSPSSQVFVDGDLWATGDLTVDGYVESPLQVGSGDGNLLTTLSDWFTIGRQAGTVRLAWWAEFDGSDWRGTHSSLDPIALSGGSGDFRVQSANNNGNGGVVTFDTKFIVGGDTGRVGIGGSPSYKLDVRENTGDFAARIFNDGNASDRRGLIIQGGQDSNPSNIFISFRDGDGNGVCSVVGDGSGGVDFNTTSDERRKQDITPLSKSLDAVLALRPVEYRGKGADRSRAKVPGFIAQEVMEAIPAAARYDEESDLYSIAWNKIIPHLVGAVQELAAEVEELKQRGPQA